LSSVSAWWLLDSFAAGEAFVRVGNEARFTQLTIGNDIYASLSLLAHHLSDSAPHLRIKLRFVNGLAL